MATKRQNIQHQLKTELYDQFYRGKGTSRHEAKIERNEYAHHDKLYTRSSLKTHLSRAKGFAKWLKESHPEVKELDDISRSIAGEYLQAQQEKGYTTRTIESDMTMINHVQIGRDKWSKEERLTKKEFNIKPRNKNDIKNNRGQKESNIKHNEYHQKVIEFGQAFGLRKSELVPNRQNDLYAVATNSIYLKGERIFLITEGKGGRFRTIEALESHQNMIQSEYGEYIQKVEELPNQEQFRSEYDKEKQLFKSISNNARIHVNCRQYYTDQKLNELEKSGRQFELLSQNKMESGKETYKTNGREMRRDHAQFVSQQLGHNRIYELKSYVNLQNDFE